MKTKKIVGAIVAAVMSASLAAGLSACANGHTHSWQWKDVGGGYHRQECSCGETTSPEPHRNDDTDMICDDCGADLTAVVEVTKVTLDQTSATLTAGGETLTLTATVTPEGAASVIWESSDASVAKVENGVVTPLKEGNAVITAKAGAKSATCNVKVNAATSGKPVEMTAEKWEQALNLGGKVGVEQTVTGGGIESHTIAKLDGGKTYLKISEEDFAMEMYLEKAQSKNYVYSRSYEYWSKSEVTDEQFAQYGIQENFDSGKELFPFDKFEKGTANGEYVSKAAYTVEQTDVDGESHTMNIKEAKIRFSAEGKAVYAEYVNVADGVEYTNTMDLTYGETIVLPEALEGEQVTQKEMAAALAMTDTNYRMGLYNMYGAVAFEYQQSGTDKKFVIGAYFSDNTEQDEMYFAKEGNKFYRYNGKYGHWSKTELNGMTDQIYGSEITGPGYAEIDLSAYPTEAFTYNPEAKAYVMSGEDRMVVAKFKNKKLVSATIVEMNGLNMSMNTVEFVYGDAEVTLPTIHAGEQVTDGEWATAKAMNFDNIEVYQNYNLGTMVYKKVGDAIYRKTTGTNSSEIYVVKEGDKYYAFAVEQGHWKREEIEKSNYDSLNIALMFAGANKSDFTWDAASGTYTGNWNDTDTSIKFVDKKIDAVITEYGYVYLNYGTAKLTLPKDGDKYEGTGIIITPTPPEGMDISEDEWRQLFEEVENSEVLTVHFGGGESHATYMFDSENGYISVSDNTEECVYAVDNGKVWKYEYNRDEYKISKTRTVFNTLEELKEELFGMFFEGENGAGINDMYDDFSGSDGSYGYRVSNSENWFVNVRDGKLENISYNNGDAYRSCYFEREIYNAPNWYLDYEGQIATAAEWNQAFLMDYDRYHILSINGQGFEMYKDGDNYRVVKDGEDNYYGIEGGAYFHYGYDEQTGSRTKEEISEAAFNTATQLPQSYDYADFELAEDENGSAYYKNADDSVHIIFWKNKVQSIIAEDFMLIYEYECDELLMPQDKMTEEEWTAAIDAAFEADYLRYDLAYMVVFVDKNSGLIYVSNNESEINGELYVLEDNELQNYVSTENGDGCIKQSTDQTFEGLLDWLKAYVIEPDAVDGLSITANYEHFEHNGLGGYTYVIDTETNSCINVQFRGGKLWKVQFILTEDNGDGTTTTMDLQYFVTECDSEHIERNLPYWYVNSKSDEK